MRLDARARAEPDVAQHRAGADLHAVAELDAALEHDADVEHDVGAESYAAAQVEARRVGQAHAGAHQDLGGAALVGALEPRQLHGVVGALGFAGDQAWGLRRGAAVGARHREDVGEVVLALRVVVLQAGEIAAQRRRVVCKEPGVDLVDA